ncbi:MAG: hypothetical protein HYT76_02505 [Deltaproteobacteria bacterium]|nr:hypothetical protein [Deltaproteobacteria bacterium]
MKKPFIRWIVFFIILFGQTMIGRSMFAEAAEWEDSVVVLLARFENPKQSSVTPVQVHNMVFGESGSLKAFMEENSYGRETIFGEVHGWYTLPRPTREQCLKHDDAFEDEVVQQVVDRADDDVDFSLYRHLIVIFQATPCFGGTAGGESIRLESDDYDGTKGFKLVTINGRLSLFTLAHEFGHNLGLDHAYAYECGDVSTITPLPPVYPPPLWECQRWEYEDHYTTMGTRAMHHNALYKEYLGWFDEEHQLIEVTESGTYTIQPISSQKEGIKAIKILKEDGPNEIQPLGPIYYYLEFRQPIGFDAVLPLNHPTYGGLLIHQGGDDYNSSSSDLLDMTPNSHPHYTDLLIENDFLGARDFFDAALAVGQVYQDDDAGIEIKPLAITDEGIIVNIFIPQRP